MFAKRKNIIKTAGFSLLEILIGVSICSTALYFLQDKLGSSFQASKRINLLQSRNSAEQFLHAHLSCSQSFIGVVTCTPNATVALKDALGDEIVSATTGRKVGEWTMKAQCNATGNGVLVKIAWLKPGATINSTQPDYFYPDPLTKKRLDWNHALAPLNNGNYVCPSATGSASSWCESNNGCAGTPVLCIVLGEPPYTNDINWSETLSTWQAGGIACSGGVIVRQ